MNSDSSVPEYSGKYPTMERIAYAKIDRWLDESGLEAEDMLVRPLDASVKNALGLPSDMGPDDAAVIPYFGISGSPVSYYRTRLLSDSDGFKYKQTPNQGSRVYFPRKFAKVLQESKSNFVILTEGEKKAACAVKQGLPAIAFGGVWNFRNKTTFLSLENHTVKAVNKGRSERSKGIVVKSQDAAPEDFTLAEGLSDLIEMMKDLALYPIIIYDTDIFGVKKEVQNAAAALGHTLVKYGVEWFRVKQLVLPNRINSHAPQKMGLDDYVVSKPTISLKELIVRIVNSRVAFPRFPGTKEYVTKASVKNRSQEEDQRLALIMHVEMEYRTQRCMTLSGDGYYQILDKGIVMKADFPVGQGSPSPDKSKVFGYLFREFGLWPNMERAIGHLATWFSHGEGSTIVEPRKVIAPATIKGDHRNLIIQINDNHVVATGASGIELGLNCSHGTMFLPDQTIHTDENEVASYLPKCLENYSQAKPRDIWYEALQTSNIVGDRDKELFALIARIYPWLQMWNDYRMPILLLQGEHESGKSSTLDLLQHVVTGRTTTRSKNSKEGDLNAFISQAGPILVFDNTGPGSKKLTAEMQDEISRIVTSGEPTVATRKLYTTDDVKETPVRCCFAVTSISSPFKQLDFISRSVEFNFSPSGYVDTEWAKDQLNERGGRAAWLADQAVFLHKFFQIIEEQYKIHRLSRRDRFRMKGFVPALEAAERVFGREWEWVGPYLDKRHDDMAKESDRAVQGLIIFKDHTPPMKRFRLRDIVAFFPEADADEVRVYGDNFILGDVLALAKFVKLNEKRLQRILGLTRLDTLDHGVAQYHFEPAREGQP